MTVNPGAGSWPTPGVHPRCTGATPRSHALNDASPVWNHEWEQSRGYPAPRQDLPTQEHGDRVLPRCVRRGEGSTEKVWTAPEHWHPWRLLGTDIPGCYRLVDDWDGKVLDSNADREVYTHPSNEGNYQKWRMVDGGDGYWCLHNLSTGLALDSNGDQEAYTQRPNDGSYQRWKFNPL